MDKDIHDLVIVGAGPAAMSAAIYTTREDIQTVVYDKGVIGGLAAITDWIDNYPGFPDGLAGLELAERLEKQAKRFGAQFEFGEVSKIEDKEYYKELTVDGTPVKARAVLIATGTAYRKIGVPGEEEYLSRGVHYCATCDGAFYRDKNLVVIGGGNSAVQESLFLTKFASHIDMLVRSTVKASDVLVKELEKNTKITVQIGIETKEIVGENGKVTKVLAKRSATGEAVEYPTDGVFIFVGLDPNTGFLKDSLKLDGRMFVEADQRMETSMAGVFCAGDCRSGATMQIATAVGEGATAAMMIREYLESMKK